jgi:hypothetical protein
MKKTFSGIVLFTFLVISCSEAPKNEEAAAPAATEEAKTEIQMPDSATMMKNWETYMTPGPIHAMIASWDGTWLGESSMFEGPDKPRVNYSLTTVNKMIMGGRYQEATNTGEMMGMPFEGRSLTAYDNHKKVFKTTWIDNFGTGIMVLEGPWDEATKSMKLTGTMIDPGMGDGLETPMREVFKIVDADHQEMQMFANYPGMGEVMMMEIKWTRKK